jgi:hypothetical protein
MHQRIDVMPLVQNPEQAHHMALYADAAETVLVDIRTTLADAHRHTYEASIAGNQQAQTEARHELNKVERLAGQIATVAHMRAEMGRRDYKRGVDDSIIYYNTDTYELSRYVAGQPTNAYRYDLSPATRAGDELRIIHTNYALMQARATNEPVSVPCPSITQPLPTSASPIR